MRVAKIYEGHWTREEVLADSNSVYVFGENACFTSGNNVIEHQPNNTLLKGLYYPNKCYGNKTQAVIRGLDNAFPLMTKKSPKKGDYFTIEDLHDYIALVKADLSRLEACGKDIILSSAGYATGSAALPEELAKVTKAMWNFRLGYRGVHMEITPHPTVMGSFGIKPVSL